jgi:hypothetical protein
MDDLLHQLDLAEERLRPFVTAYDEGQPNEKWVTENDRALLSRVLAAIEAAREDKKTHQTHLPCTPRGHSTQRLTISPCYALTSALEYLNRHRHSMSPLGSPLTNALLSPGSTRKLGKFSLRPSPLASDAGHLLDKIKSNVNFPNNARASTTTTTAATTVPCTDTSACASTTNTTITATATSTATATATNTTSITTTITTSSISSSSSTPTPLDDENNVVHNIVQRSKKKKVGKKKRFGTVLSSNTINNRTTTRISAKKLPSLQSNNINVLETF